MKAIHRHSDRGMMLAATLTAGTLLAQQVGSKAVRDALFLSRFPVTALPMIVFATAIFSVGASVLAARLLTKHGPHKVIPWTFVASAITMALIWAMGPMSARGQAIALYLQVSAIGMIQISGFWSLINESYDQRGSRQRLARIAAFGTLGGLVGGALATQVGATWGLSAILPMLAALHGVCAITTLFLHPLRPRHHAHARPPSHAHAGEGEAWVGLKVFGRVPYMRMLAALVLLSTIAAALIDYVFKVQATRHLAPSTLLPLFAAFYTGIGVLSFLIQVTLSRPLFDRLGLGRTMAALPLGVATGSLVGLILPGPVSAAFTRTLEAVLTDTLYRAGYEVLFSPVPTREKRATKAIVDVGVERVGDALGAGIIQAVLLLGVALTVPLLLGLSILCSLIGLGMARRVQSGYVEALERHLLSRSNEVEEKASVDRSLTHTIEMVWAEDSGADFLQEPRGSFLEEMGEDAEDVAADARAAADEPFFRQVTSLRGADPAHVRQRIVELGPITPALAPHVIPLLAWDAVADTAAIALRSAAPRIVGQLVDALLNPEEEFAIRRRIPRIIADCPSPIAVEGLFHGLLDRRFEVRYRSGRALLHLHESVGIVELDPERVYLHVLREMAVDRSVWASHRLLELPEDEDEARQVDAVLRDRIDRSLEHVFTMLSLALPMQPLRIAFRGLHADDPTLRSTALEYLESVLPPRVREGLWPILEGQRAPAAAARPREEVLADLLRSNESIALNLLALRRKDPRP